MEIFKRLKKEKNIIGGMETNGLNILKNLEKNYIEKTYKRFEMLWHSWKEIEVFGLKYFCDISILKKVTAYRNNLIAQWPEYKTWI